MIRGTTAQFKFNLPYSYSDLSVVKITFWQYKSDGTRNILATKTLANCSRGNNYNELSVTLTQEETLRFSDEKKAYVQLRASSTDGYAFASQQEQITVYPICDDSVLGDEDVELPPAVDEEWVYLDGGSIA